MGKDIRRVRRGSVLAALDTPRAFVSTREDYVTKIETITITGQEWLPIKVEDIARVDHPPVSQQCSTLFFKSTKAIRIELKSGSVRWTKGCRRWWSEKEKELLMAANRLENRARDLRREASRYSLGTPFGIGGGGYED